MNERILELAYEAEEQAEREVDQSSGFNGETFHPAFCRIFAELIVKDVCQKLENDGMVEIAMEMKQHFGVEQ